MSATKKNYSTLTSGNGTGATTTSPPPWWRRPMVVGLAGLLVVALVVWAIIAAVGGGSSSDSGDAGQSQAIRSAHGPTSITKGVPSGYTDDKAGAASAAANFVAAVGEARLGRISGDAVRDQLVTPQPSDSLVKVLDVSSGRQDPQSAGSTTNSVPVVTSVTQFSKDRAQVAVWSVNASQSTISDGGRVGVSTLWSTTTVTLIWTAQDWKASDWAFQLGPDPDQAMFPAGDSPLRVEGTGGRYTFFVD
ncbi:hypothetical protein [Gordonia sp. N1V]|uniref:hypothetical protein n=1 Tax=Gordonia sp. N1V TaxID=3034163 RepID=UPI0023E346D1|nr:hypothetical protein [Gordonia sp. N1V]MDF3285033.1 hypothetical protein [Gordonia sp. N1V]